MVTHHKWPINTVTVVEFEPYDHPRHAIPKKCLDCPVSEVLDKGTHGVVPLVREAGLAAQGLDF